MPVKKVVKKPTVHVETKKMSNDSCYGFGWGKCYHRIIMILLVVNIVLTTVLFGMYAKLESARAGWWKNYHQVQRIYKTDAYKQQQTQSIEQALQMYQAPAQTIEMDTQDLALPTE